MSASPASCGRSIIFPLRPCWSWTNASHPRSSAGAWRRAGAKEQANIVLPPVMLESTQAECLLAAVAKRLPLPLAGFRDMCCRFILVVNTDSGTSGI